MKVSKTVVTCKTSNESNDVWCRDMDSEEAQEKKLDVVEMRFTALSWIFLLRCTSNSFIPTSVQLGDSTHPSWTEVGMKELEVQRRRNIQESAVK